MMAFLRLTFILSILIDIAHAECTFSEVFGDIKVADIGGAKMYTHFTRHLMEEYKQLNDALNEQTLAGGKKKLYKILSDSKNQATITREKKETADLISLVKSNKLAWIGIEASSEQMANFMPVEVEIAKYWKIRKLLTYALKSEEQADDLTYLYFDSDLIAQAKHPTAFKNTKFIPLDNAAARAETRKLQIDHVGFVIKLGDLVEERGTLSSKQLRTVIFLGRDADNTRVPVPQDVIEGMVKQVTDEETRRTIRGYLNTTNRLLELSDIRNRSAANAALKQSGTGLILMGSNHGPSIMNYLTTACDKGFSNVDSYDSRQ